MFVLQPAHGAERDQHDEVQDEARRGRGEDVGEGRPGVDVQRDARRRRGGDQRCRHAVHGRASGGADRCHGDEEELRDRHPGAFGHLQAAQGGDDHEPDGEEHGAWQPSDAGVVPPERTGVRHVLGIGGSDRGHR